MPSTIERLSQYRFVISLVTSLLIWVTFGIHLGDVGRLIAVVVFMKFLWIFEIVPIAVTALLPVLLFPALDILSLRETIQQYSHPIMFLFLGGFSLALALESSGLHRRVAFYALTLASLRLDYIVAAFMAVTAFLSMWISNSATAIMMLPVALSVGEVIKNQVPDAVVKRFRTVLMLSIAYSANIGGVATLIGSPPNALYAAFMRRDLNVDVTFLDWMLIGLPLSLIMLPFAWFLLTKVLFPLPSTKVVESRDLFVHELSTLGKMSHYEKRVGLVFVATVFLWISHPIFTELFGIKMKIDDAQIAIVALVSLFLIPRESGAVEKLMEWKVMKEIPWEVLILFGGGLAIAHAIGSLSLTDFLQTWADKVSGVPIFILVVGLSLAILFMTEVTSNTATAAAFLPLASSFATAIDVPSQVFLIPVTLASSCAFMLPIATPPNAIVYGTGAFTINQMVKAGFALNVVSALVIAILTTIYLELIW
ncbi:MAG: hypothetical protein RLZZ488_2637 [Pseudomonadota bacterium]|jgi:sodium-dependent dicarboxylate transporter 2/3/5